SPGSGSFGANRADLSRRRSVLSCCFFQSSDFLTYLISCPARRRLITRLYSERIIFNIWPISRSLLWFRLERHGYGIAAGPSIAPSFRFVVSRWWHFSPVRPGSTAAIIVTTKLVFATCYRKIQILPLRTTISVTRYSGRDRPTKRSLISRRPWKSNRIIN